LAELDFTCYDKETMTSIYKAYVCPHIKFAVQAWSPWAKKDIELLESVQKRMVHMISGLMGTYEDKLKQIGFTSLEDRRRQG
jgi:ribonuclease P/MRP protein subunit RPP40